MLRLPTDRLAIALCPGQIAIVRRTGSWRRKKTQTVFSVATDAATWPAALDVLAGWLDAAEGVKNAPATVTVSNRWARFALVPWSAAVASGAEEASLALACLETAHGDMTGWTLGMGTGRYGQPRIACALEAAFLERLRVVLGARGIACQGVWPYLVSALRQGRAFLAQSAGLLAVAESDTVVLVSTQQGRWHSLRSVGSDLAPAKLVQVLEREVLLQGMTEPSAKGVMAPGVRLAEIPGVTLLQPAVQASSPAEGMALDAVTISRQAVNFTPRIWSSGRVIGVLGLVATLGLVAGLGWHTLQLRQQQEAWQGDWQRLHRLDTRSRTATTPEERERLKAELRFANRVIEKLDTPWDSLFEAVESAFHEQVTLLSVEPDTERREVRLLAEAKDIAAMLDYVRQVRLLAALKDAYLVDHQINLQDAYRPVRFTVMAQWAAPLPVVMPASTAATADGKTP